jgi:hypothetical protein
VGGGKLAVICFDACLAGLGGSHLGVVGTDLVAEPADHLLDLDVEVVDVRRLQLLEVLQLLSIAQLQSVILPVLAREFIMRKGRRQVGLP